MRQRRHTCPARQRLRLLGLVACLALAYPPGSQALPGGAQVVQGQALVSVPQAGQGLVQQTSARAVIHWQSFSIQSGEVLRVEQPGPQAVLLNRVVGRDPSQLFGRLQSNGQVFLLNPNGIVFARGSQIDVGGLVASTLSLSDAAFMAGRYSLAADGPSGSLRADGVINAPQGTVALAAPQLDVGGSIRARRAGLAAAGAVTVDVEGDGLVLFQLRPADGQDTALRFTGQLSTSGGPAELRAQARAGVAGQVLNMDGVVQARGLRQEGGRIVIDGGTAGDAFVNGVLDARAEQQGGSVTVLGQRVALLDGARLDASGRLGGGSLQVGGGFHGRGTAHTADRTWIAAGAHLAADATERGDGGSVAVWSEGRTDMLGRITARGGLLGGNGGHVETSGRQQLHLPSGGVDVSAANGRAGRWLLDPHDLRIATGNGIANVAPTAPFTTTADAAVLGVELLNAALAGGANVVVQTTDGPGSGQDGNITVAADIVASGPSTLNLQALGRIDFTGFGITGGNGALNVVLQAGGSITGSTITANGGGVQATARGRVAVNSITGSDLSIISNGGAVVLPTGTVGGMLQVDSGGGRVTQEAGGLVVSGAATIHAGVGPITLTDPGNDFRSTVSLTGGATQISNGSGHALTLGQLATGDLSARTSGGAALRLGTGSVAGALDAATAGGPLLQQPGGLDVLGVAQLDAGAGNLLLDAQGNQWRGGVQLAAGTLNLRSAGDLTVLSMGRPADGGLTLDAGGNLLVQAATVDTGASPLALSSAGTLTTAGRLLGSSVTLGAQSGLAVGNDIVASGTLGLTTLAGGILQSGGSIVAGGMATVSAGSSGVRLDQAGNLFGGPVRLTGGSSSVVSAGALDVAALDTLDSTLRAGGALGLGGGTVAGALSATSPGGGISQTAALTVRGPLALDAGTGQIVLAHAGNDLQGPVTAAGASIALRSATPLDVAGVLQQPNSALTLQAGGALLLPAAGIDTGTAPLRLSSGGSLVTAGTLRGGDVSLTAASLSLQHDVTAGGVLALQAGAGDITQTGGRIAAAGTSRFDAGAGSVALGAPLNDFSGAVGLLAGAARLASAGDLTLGQVAVGSLQLQSGGNLRQAAGGVQVGGDSALVATGAITLPDTGNAWGGAVGLAGGTVQIASGGALRLGTLAVGALVAQADGSLSLGQGRVAGPVTASSQGGDITQSGALEVAGPALVQAGGGSIALSAAGNRWLSTVQLAGGAVQLAGSGALRLGLVDTGSLDVRATGPVDLGQGTVAGSLRVRSDGNAIQQSGALRVGGGALLDAGSGTVTLASPGNALQGALGVTGGGVTLASQGDVSLGDVAAASLDVTARGHLTLNGTTAVGALRAVAETGAIAQAAGALSVAGSADLQAAQSVALPGAANHLQGTVRLASGGDSTLRNMGPLVLAGGEVGGALGVRNDGAVTQTGALRVAGDARVDAAGAAIVLDRADNVITGTVHLLGGGPATLRSAGPGLLRLGQLQLGQLDVAAQGPLQLGAGTVRGTLNAASSGDITQAAGGLSVGGAVGLEAGSGNGHILLGDAANSFGGAVRVRGRDVTVASAGGLQLGPSSVLGDLSVLAGGGSIAQTGALAVAGSTQWLADGGTVQLTLNDAGNRLQGGVRAGGLRGGAFSSVDLANALDLQFSGDAQVLSLATAGRLALGTVRSGTLTSRAATGIGQSGPVVVGGLASFVADGGALELHLGQPGNDLAQVQLSSRQGGSFARVQLREDDAVRGDGLQLGGDAGTLAITSAGRTELLGGRYGSLSVDTSASGADIGQAGAIAVAGGTTLRAGGGSIRLARADNSLPDVAIASAGMASVATAGDLQLRDSTVSMQLALASPGLVTLQGTLSGAAALVLAGTGSLRIDAPQAYSGGTRIASGRLVLQGAAALPGTGAVVLGADSEIDLRDGAVLPNALVGQGGSVLNTAGSGTLAGPVTIQATTTLRPQAGLSITGAIADGGNGRGLRLLGPGALTLSGSNAYAGPTAIVAGTLRAATAGALPSASAVQLGAGAVLALGADQRIGSLSGDGSVELGAASLATGFDGTDTRFAGSLLGTGDLLKLGAGSFTLAGTAGRTGSTQVLGGDLVLAASGVLDSSRAVSVGAGARLTVQHAAALRSLAGSGTVVIATPRLELGSGGASTVFDGVLAGSGSLVKQGSGRLTLAGRNTLAGDVQVLAGVLQLAAPAALPTSTGVEVAAGAQLDLAADQHLAALTGNGQVHLNPFTLTVGAATRPGRDGRFDGVLDGTGALVKAGSGTLTLGGANLHTGGTRASGGTLVLDAEQALAAGSGLAIGAGATVQARRAQTLGSLEGAGVLDLRAPGLAVGQGGGDSRFDGSITGTGALVKQGAGTFTLAGAASNGGRTVVEAGALRLAGNGSLGPGDIVNQGILLLDRAEPLLLQQAISGLGGLVVRQGLVTLGNAANSYAGATRVLGGSLATAGAERLPDASAVQVAAGARLLLNGNETIATLQADGDVRLAGHLGTAGAQVYTGRLSLANAAGITLSGSVIDASRSSNQFAGTPLGLSGGTALVDVAERLQLGDVTLSAGGRIAADRVDLGGRLQLAGGQLSLVARALPDETRAVPQGIARVPVVSAALAVAEATVHQAAGSVVHVAAGAGLQVQAAGGGSVLLGQDANQFQGWLSVLSGAASGTAWTPNVAGSGVGVQSLVRVAGGQLTLGGHGIEADLVSLRADRVSLLAGARLVARMPFDQLLLGRSLSAPGLTFELAPEAFSLPGSFGTIGGVALPVEVGSTLTGARTSGPNAGYVTVLPKGGAMGMTAVVLGGPEVGTGPGAPYRFFHDGARLQSEIPVVYNGVLPLSPAASGALSSVNGEAESARNARFQETVRTENVTLRLRAGVIAEVGPGRAATEGKEGSALPPLCEPAAQPALSCNEAARR